MNIAVIHGGYSTEHAISTANANHVEQSLKELGHDAYLLEYTKDIATTLLQNTPEAVFLCVQGKGHGDGTLQGILEHLEIPYTGSKREAATIINNKIICQKMFHFEGIPIAPFCTWNNLEHHSKNAKELFLQKMESNKVHFPCLAKAPSQGGSFGIAYLKSAEDFSIIEELFQYDVELLIEEFIHGNFYTVSMLNYKGKFVVFPPREGRAINNTLPFVSFVAGFECLPANLPENIASSMQAMAEKAHKCVGAYGYSRADFMLDEKTHIPKLLELNAVPGVRPHCLFSQTLQANGISYNEMVTSILQTINLGKC